MKNEIKNRLNWLPVSLNIRYVVLCLSLFCSVITKASSYGESIFTDKVCTVWWTGSTYKVMQNEACPDKKGKVAVWSAKNETESFQLVLSPLTDLKNISVAATNLKNGKGEEIGSENVVIRKVEYVHVTKPSGTLHKAGLYPDPLPQCTDLFDALEKQNTPLFITIKVPNNVSSGKYTGEILIESSGWETTVPVELNVWDFSLPELPKMRSGFGMSTARIKQYHNLDTKDELEQVTDMYFRSFKDYRISPYYFYDLAKIKRTVKGICWTGGVFDPETTYEGKYSYQLKNSSNGRFTDLIKIDPTHPYLLKWQAKTFPEGQKYSVIVKCYDEEKQPLYWSMKWMKYEGCRSWRLDTLFIDTTGFFAEKDLPDYRPFPENARYASIHLSGPPAGDVWFDDFQFVDEMSGENLLPHGDFEQDIDELDIEIDFSDFDEVARKYLDEFGFSGFRFGVPGLAKKSKGVLNGFVSGTPEYKKLMKLYLKPVQDHLEQNGWLGKEYLYWADEPDHEHYKFVREGMEAIYEAAPKLTRFITENNPGPEIMDVTEIGCPVLYQINPEKVKEWSGKGRKFWSYLMCWPKEPHLNLFIDSYAINMRMWLWISYKYNLVGILVWNSNQWNGAKGAAPDGIVQNIWEDPMTYKSGWGTPYGSAPEYGNGDGMFFYPPNRDPNSDKTKYMSGPVPSLRLEILREGLDDYDYMIMLEECIKDADLNQKKLVAKAKKILDFGSEVFVSDRMYSKDPKVLMDYRMKMGELLSEFERKKNSKE
ncbi:DUF4091 domain-containing protein [Prolixibacteraceae bacterium Z1-6]|uniref:DUF4091 domain-containing protein n=1 Tax=Draconibacterium aestuarii TaxID=2998507 RepID=A0A9X3F328_9BACT|nr:DUF4091 domain-containing protein [Prolixibacteraceae bacterium Z1-6]